MVHLYGEGGVCSADERLWDSSRIILELLDTHGRRPHGSGRPDNVTRLYRDRLDASLAT
jgi:hypothetical protein